MSTFNLQEAYYQIYEQEQLDEISVETIKSASDQAGRLAGQAAALGAPDYAKKKRKQQERLYTAQAKKRLKTKTAKITREETDLFDYVLEYLVSEGYADTNENALVIMANMSEEWREDIMEISQKTAIRAYADSSTGEFEGQDSPRDVERTDRLRRHIKRKFGEKAAKHADRAAHAKTFGRKGAGGMPPKP